MANDIAFEETLHQIETGDILFNMDSFYEPASDHACQSKACLAGQAAIAAGHYESYDTEDGKRFLQPAKGGTWAEWGREVLGLTRVEAEILFYHSMEVTTPEELRERWIAVTKNGVTTDMSTEKDIGEFLKTYYTVLEETDDPNAAYAAAVRVGQEVAVG